MPRARQVLPVVDPRTMQRIPVGKLFPGVCPPCRIEVTDAHLPTDRNVLVFCWIIHTWAQSEIFSSCPAAISNFFSVKGLYLKFFMSCF